MSTAKTLLQLAGADLNPAKLADATLVLIDIQNEYLEGPIAVDGAQAAVAAAAHLLKAARAAGTPIFHVAHQGKVGSLFDRIAPRGQLIDAVAPLAAETVVEKTLPNSFASTDLHALLSATGRKQLLLAGFMTHMCVSSTARAALDLGYRVTLVADACATRDLPDGQGGVVPAATLHKVALVELSDRFAVIAQTAAEID
ncbi:nicotinamidase-related amidase [Rhodopseudomonas rhenobacensis]|uniref:Nicotinamidase-related amidase n=1 Tax=Rhodopseudomonas rhenobacensis TaxID=87461 RepID=A0A7W8DZH3_9BRAD|nr:cysteine hydrolase family protein [Rhodopseudomonas rhenobacensis]MBB5046881.1 nicotinamidase-related amidase [Rhodopseudomonas rhenobacensis]